MRVAELENLVSAMKYAMKYATKDDEVVRNSIDHKQCSLCALDDFSDT